MPNQRSKNKAYLGGYIDKALHAKVVKRAKEEGMEHNKFGFVAILLRKAIRRQAR
jgi:hypothetical protein